MIKVSAPGKIHLLGEHMVVYGKPALLTTVNLRATVSISPVIASEAKQSSLKKIIEPIIKKYLKIKTIPPYQLNISSQIPGGSGLGSSAAVSAACIAALLSFLKIKWDKTLINKLTFEAEKVFHGNPSGGDNSAVVYGGLIWFPMEKLDFTIPRKLAKNFVLINTGKPKETTKEMVELVKSKVKSQKSRFRKIFDSQEQLVRKLLATIKDSNENQLIEILRAGEKNLESMGVVSSFVKEIIRKIEKAGGAAKICGAGGKRKATGILLAYHKNRKEPEKIAQSLNLPFFSVALGVEGLRREL